MGRPRFVASETTSVPWHGLKGNICHEYDDFGNHRLTNNGCLGDWACYASIASMTIGDKTFKAYTDYHSNCNEIEEIIAVLPRALYDIYRKD